MSEQKFIWLDLETTNLNPYTGIILEVAAVATNNKLVELDKYQAVLEYDFRQGHIDDGLMSNEAFKMHTANGLLKECQNSLKDALEVEKELSKWVKQFGEKPILAGNSVHFDKNWAHVQFPNFLSEMHYRILDVSSIKEMLKNFYNFQYSKTESNHRALVDVYASIEEFRKYLSILKLDMYSY